MVKKDIERDEAQELDTDHAETRVYELGFHIDSDLAETEVKKVYAGIKEVIAAGGEVIAEGEPRHIQLAYTVSRSETTGRRDWDASYFAWIAYETDGAGHEKVTEAAGADTRIFRFIDLRTTKDAARHSSELHELLSKVPEKNDEEEVSDVEIDAALKEVGV